MFDALLLKTFVTVVDEEGFSRAAQKLHLTQSAISGHVRRLEEQVGKPLLTRTTRSQQLTPDGERLLSYARTILELNRDAWAELTRTPPPCIGLLSASPRRNLVPGNGYRGCMCSIGYLLHT